MKRSEAVNIIHKSFDQWEFDEMSEKSLGDLILDALHKRGLLQLDYSHYFSGWEPEDD